VRLGRADGEEAERFHRNESAAIEFEKAYAAGDDFRAAIAAAALGIDLDAGLTAEQRKAVAKAAAQAPVAFL